MDHNSYAAYGYGDTGYGSLGADHSSDPANQYGWTQWSQPTSQQAQQQQQQQSQNQYQSFQKSFGSSFGVMNNYGQQSQQGPKKQKFPKGPQGRQQGGFGTANNFTSAGFSTFAGVGGGEWGQPPSHSNSFGAKKAGFPKKGMPMKKFPGNPSQPRTINTAGKKPAMLLHELFKNVTEDYEEVPNSNPKLYKCILTVNGQQFKAESGNKKNAKQKTAEIVIRTLRPELEIAPFIEPEIPTKPVKQAAKQTTPKNNSKRNAMEMSTEQVADNGNAKKAKLSPLESASSLLDFMRKLINEGGNKYKPVFEASEVPSTTSVKVEEGVKSEPMEVDAAKGDFKKNRPDQIVTLKFEEQGKVYSKIGPIRPILKEMVVREALRDLFNVSLDDIRKVSRRQAVSRLGYDQTVSQTLAQLCSLLNCSLTLVAEPAEDKPLGDGKMFFTGKCKIVDHYEGDKVTEISSPSLGSKAMAKDYAAQEMLKDYFQVDPSNYGQNEGAAAQGPCAVLHTLINKQSRVKTKIGYEFKENVPPVAGQNQTVFYCDCVINEKDRYTGSGRSKKLAKSDSAVAALKKLFNIDYDPKMSLPFMMNTQSVYSKVSPLCKDITEFSKREYYSMMKFFDMSPSTQFACFYLINEKNEKRLVSVGSSVQYVVEPDTLNGANGTSIIHMDPIVLARRALIRYFIQELQSLEQGLETSIFENGQHGRTHLKSNLRLVLFTSYAPNCNLSVDDAPIKKLAYLTPTSIQPCPEDVLSLEHIKATKTLRVHCTADKVFKWSHVGVQGALLSNVLDPIFIDTVFVGTIPPVSDESLIHALGNRFGEPLSKLKLESAPNQGRMFVSYPHAWSRSHEGVEQFDCNTGRTNKGSPSKFCKAEIVEAFRKLKNVDSKVCNYAQMKQKAVDYQKKKNELYNKLQENGFGKWQTKPIELVDDFNVSDFD